MQVENKDVLEVFHSQSSLKTWEKPICQKLSVTMTFADPTCADQIPPKSLGSPETFQITDTVSIICSS